MVEASFNLTKQQVRFLMSKFHTEDPQNAIDLFLESLVVENKDPFKMLKYLSALMAKENN